MTGPNPNNPSVIGLEWPVLTESAQTVDDAQEAVGIAFHSNSAETIDKTSVYVSASAVSGFAKIGVYAVAVWPLATITESPTVTTSTFRPNEDVSVANLERTGGGAATVGTSYTEIDESTQNLADWLRTNGSSTSTSCKWVGRAAVGVGNLTGKQILKVRLCFVTDTEGTQYVFKGLLNIAGTEYTIQKYTHKTQATLIFEWNYNPNTNKPWTIADVEKFDTTDEIGFDTRGSGFLTYCYQGWLEVDTVPEQRIAIGTVTPFGVGWVESDLSTPTGGTTWSKANGTDYLITVRKLLESSPGAADSFRYLDSGSDPPGGQHGYAPLIEGTNGRFVELGDPNTKGFAFVLSTSTPSTSPDSQPYADLLMADVYTGHTVEAEILGVAANYGVVKAVIASQSESAPTANLLVKVRKRSDLSQIGTTMTFTPDQLVGTQTALREILVSMPTAGLTAVQVYLEFSTTAANGGGWQVAVLDTLGTGSSAGYGGTTQAATIGGVESTSQDVVAVLAQVPSAPTNFLATMHEQAGTGHEYIGLTWTATALGASFSHYEIERNDDGVWRTIAWITTESVQAFDDHESLRDVEADYRMVVVHTNMIPSGYTAVSSATAAANGHRMALVSNEDPLLNVNYFDTPGREYEFLNHPTVYELEDTDDSFEARPLNDRGDRFPLTLIVGHLREIVPETIGRKAFDPLLALINNADLSYVCVLDWDGNRWYASCDIVNGRRLERGGRYYASVIVRTLVSTPSTPDVV